MALSLSSNFSNAATANLQDVITLVHVYYNDTQFYAISDNPVTYSTTQYLAILDSISRWGETWNLYGENGVSNAAPELVLNQYNAFDDSFDLQELFGTNQFTGKKIVIYIGYQRITTLGDNLIRFSGYIDSVKFDGGKCHIACRTREVPDVAINGAQIAHASQKIGGTSYSALIIPKESDEKYLPVPFGVNWCSPAIAYDVQADGDITYCTLDHKWWDTYIYSAGTNIQSRWRNNTKRTQPVFFVLDNEFLVPIYPTCYTGVEVFTVGLDSGANRPVFPALYLRGDYISPIRVGPQQIHAWVPLAFELRRTTSYTYTNISSHDAEANIAYIFDGDQSNSWQMQSTTIGAVASLEISSMNLSLFRNLRHDKFYCINPDRPIHIPYSDESFENADTWTTLMLGRVAHTGTGSNRHSAIWADFRMLGLDGQDSIDIGRTQGGGQFITNPSAQGYNYYSAVGLQNTTGSDNNIDLATDNIGASNGQNDVVADAGNSSSTINFTMGDYPALRRSALDLQVVAEPLTFRFLGNASSGTATMVIYHVNMEAIEVIAHELDMPIYCETDGIKVLSVEAKLNSREPGVTGTYQLENPIQYSEAILQAKCGANFATDFGVEFEMMWDVWQERFSIRDGSGFVTPTDKQLTTKQFFREYFSHEPFCVYLNTLGKYQVPWLFGSEEDITGYGFTLHECNCNDFLSWESGLTPYEWLCTEIKSLKTDYCIATDKYVQNCRWKLKGSYSHDYYDTKNTSDSNRFFIESIEKKYTSANEPELVTRSGIVYGCVLSNTSNAPDTSDRYWKEPVGDSSMYGTPGAWASGKWYSGCDGENRAIAKYVINQWCNLHRTFSFTTAKKQYFKYEIGDVIYFANVPETCAGLTIKGFNGDTSTTSVEVNGQDVSYLFQITGVRLDNKTITIDAIMLHDLSAFEVTRTD